MADNTLVFPPGMRLTDTSDNPLASGTVEFYDAGTSNARTVYSDNGLSTSLGSTVTLNSSGVPASGGSEVSIFTGTTDYKIIVKDSTGATVHTFDNLTGALDTSTFAAATATPTTSVIQKSADYTVLTTDRGKVIDADATGGDVTLTLPSAVTAGDNWRLTVKATGTGSGTVTLATVSAQTIDGATTLVLTYQYEAVTIVSDGANWHISESGRYHRPTFSVTPQGRLTLTSATPIITADVASGTAVYYTPYVGNLVPLYDGQRWEPQQFSELTLTLVSNHTANAIYDVFAFLDSATLRIGTGPAWSTATAGSGARGTGAGTTEIERVDGLWTNAVSMTARNGTSTYTVAANRGTYLGSILIDGTNGQVTCHNTYGQTRRFSVWNAYNRRPIIMRLGDATASWTYAVATMRQSRADTANVVKAFVGLAEEPIEVDFSQRLGANPTGNGTQIGIGENSTTTASGLSVLYAWTSASQTWIARAHYIKSPGALGLMNYNALEKSIASGSPTFYGQAANMQFICKWTG